MTGHTLSLLGILVGVVAASAGTPAPQTHSIRIENMKFVPESIDVAPGDTVTWTNADIVPHTVTAQNGKALESGTIAGGKSFSVVITSENAVDYYCRFHPLMKGKLRLSRKPSPAASHPR